ncbi:ABC transporter ATP-binding protein [Hoeflea sp.]|uniref:ABC transporter ATP-binding protein n=1 Tax=Hoeflea sp. TaxID=1940281 RepID=UPI003B02AB6D
MRVDDIRRTFHPGTVQEKKALRGISFDLEPGEFAVVIGSNGAGKSTLLNALAGEVPVDSGRIVANGKEIQNWPVHRRARLMSRVFQDPMVGTAAALTIEENLSIAARRGQRRSLRFGIRRSEREVFRQKLGMLGLGLENRLSDRVDLLSGGQRQSLTLVMATLKQPQLLLLDEHTAALDPRAAALVMRATTEVVQENATTTLMVTHNMGHAIEYGNRLLMIHEGQVILDASAEEKSKLTASSLVDRFHDVVSDRMVLS